MMGSPLLDHALKERGLQLAFVNGETKRWCIMDAHGEKKKIYKTFANRSDAIFASRKLIESGALPPVQSGSNAAGGIKDEKKRNGGTAAI